MKNGNAISGEFLHPVLFFAGVYIMAISFSIFIPSSLFYSLHSGNSRAPIKQEIHLKRQALVSAQNLQGNKD